jgi:hypothetical protein
MKTIPPDELREAVDKFFDEMEYDPPEVRRAKHRVVLGHLINRFYDCGWVEGSKSAHVAHAPTEEPDVLLVAVNVRRIARMFPDNNSRRTLRAAGHVLERFGLDGKVA